MTEFFIFFFLVAFSALFSASETAFFSLRESQVKLMEQKGEWNAKIIARLKKNSQRLLVTILIGNNLANISIASYATVLAMGYFGSFGAGIATGVSAVVVVLLGELFPKSAAYTYKKTVAQWVAGPLYFFYLLSYPASTLFVKFEQWIKRHSPFKERNVVSEEEIRVMTELGLEHGEIDKYEHEMIEKIFSFDDVVVGSVMTPKSKIDSLNGDVPVEQIAYYVSQSGFSRFPVYDGNRNEYIGYVHTNDVMRVLNSDDRESPLMKFASPLTRIDETLNTEKVFRLMTRERSHLFLVYKKDTPDEIIGLVTMEDILEEIMGEIEDEGDRKGAHHAVK